MGNANSSLNTEEKIPNDLFLSIQKFTNDNTIIFEDFFKNLLNNKASNSLEDKESNDKEEETNMITEDTLSNSCTVDNKAKKIAKNTKQLNRILKKIQPHFIDKFTYKKDKGSYLIELLSVPSWVDNRIIYTDVYDFLNKIKPYMNAFITYSRIPFTNCSVSIKRLLGKYEGYDIARDYRGQYRIFKKIIIRYLKENYKKRGKIYTSSKLKNINAKVIKERSSFIKKDCYKNII
jgi:hypothetical protein